MPVVAREDKQETGNTNRCLISVWSMRKAKIRRKRIF